MPIQGVLLDVDGTLVDSNEAHAHAWIKALAEQRIWVVFEEVRKRIGMGGDKLLKAVAGIDKDTPQGKRISQRRSEIFMGQYLPTLFPTPGAHSLLRYLHGRHFKLAVASSSEKKELEKLLRVCGADGLVEDATSADDADRSKPDPDIVQAALETIGLAAAHVVMLGDTPYDVEAARGAQIPLIGFRCGGWSAADLSGAVAVYDDPADLLRHFDESPLAASNLQEEYEPARF